ncbi:protocatechuate 3,4-dioxygenase subunit alpha [Ahrensia kielensis]|uniref:Protocatechuate 3,4-dioxygenase subunit alpha n=1 Tax=Ahrensia kielensis TaxID=76980 RepID=A0ABU9T9D2_9HYPH
MDPLEIRRTRPAKTNTQNPLRETASQTAGPYVHIGCLPNAVGIDKIYDNDLTHYGAINHKDPVTFRGQVFDGDAQICRDVMLEFWQPENEGTWHRTNTDFETGFYEIQTSKPVSMRDENGNKIAPFITVWVTARGINIGLVTRIYFSQVEGDAQLELVDESRRHTLIAKPLDEAGVYQFNIHLQGDQETVFFDI